MNQGYANNLGPQPLPDMKAGSPWSIPKFSGPSDSEQRGRASPPRRPGGKNYNFTETTHEPRKKPSYFPLYWLVDRDP